MQTKCTREAVAKPQHSELVFQHKPWTAMEKSGFATASHIKGVTITASQEGEYMYPQQQEQRNGSDGWTRTSNSRINGAVPYHWATSEFA